MKYKNKKIRLCIRVCIIIFVMLFTMMFIHVSILEMRNNFQKSLQEYNCECFEDDNSFHNVNLTPLVFIVNGG